MSRPSLQQLREVFGEYVVPDELIWDDDSSDGPASPDNVYTENFDFVERGEIVLLAEFDAKHPSELPVTRKQNASVRFESFGNLDVVHRLGDMGLFNFIFERPASFERMPQSIRDQQPGWHLVDWKNVTFVMDNVLTFAQDGSEKCFHQLVQPESLPQKKITKIIKFPYTYQYLLYKPFVMTR